MTFGENIRRHRMESGYTVKHLAYITGLSEHTIRDLEQDMRRTTLYVVVQIADTFGISIDELIGREVKKGAKDD